MKKVYTRKGDTGCTYDYAGKILQKDHIIVIIGGKIDALQSAIDLALLQVKGKDKEMLNWVQRKLWQTAGEISCADKSCIIDPVTEKDLKALEKYTDSLGEPPTKFIRFNTEKSIIFNECRIRCRELETFLVKLLRKKKLRHLAYSWINRLSSLFFMMSYKATK